MFVTQLLWCDFVVWSPSEGILLERIEYDELFTDELFTDEMVSKACIFYFDTFLPSVVACTSISTSSIDALPLYRAACVSREMFVHEKDRAQEEDGAGEDLCSRQTIN